MESGPQDYIQERAAKVGSQGPLVLISLRGRVSQAAERGAEGRASRWLEAARAPK